MVGYSFPVYASTHKLLKVNNPIPVVIALVNDLAPVDVMHFVEGGMGHFFKLVFVDGSVLILVQPYEFSLKVLELLLGH